MGITKIKISKSLSFLALNISGTKYHNYHQPWLLLPLHLLLSSFASCLHSCSSPKPLFLPPKPSDTLTKALSAIPFERSTEYDPTYRSLELFTSPFRLAFYNTTPNAYTLALRMGIRGDRSLVRFVWEANRGNPVRENATLSFGSDGNLILAEADSRIAWQPNNAHKGGVGFAILPNGNIVLRDAAGGFVWQSFDYPTDTLSLRVGGSNKLVSRASVTENVNGDYSLVLEPKRLALYCKKTMRYWSFAEVNNGNGDLLNATLEMGEAEYVDSNFNALRYRQFAVSSAWRLLYTLFKRRVNEWGEADVEDECQLPDRCGKFGLCEDSQCVGCPSPNGVFAWSKDCVAKLRGCEADSFRYYELKGVDHFTVKYGTGLGPVSRAGCESKCTKDCKCLGYFYRTDRSRCWIAHELKTLTRVGNSTHMAYIKTPLG
ncbi:hypothetical protein OSB04_008511 [Centaurea solstitialis]|uniref:Bulb-type lectin domain-containing protein n=1 Tax=Centaurea solstitialis TaxID=347529 RepID=A0AA38TXG3_9ASTR|nr:hypothetical protein OSB04_008511 [Centaurea solstitialis]